MRNEDNLDRGWVVPTSQWLVLGEIDALNSFWPLVREDQDIAPREAVNVLSTWAHVRRFSPETTDEILVERLNTLVRGDVAKLTESVLEFDFPDDWIGSAEELDDAWDFLIESDRIDDLECAIRQMFYSLDRFSLALYAVGCLAPYLRSNPQLQELRRRLDSAEEYLQLNADVFLSAAIYASTLFDAYRPDLFDFDQQLWETTLKHRCLQELVDEQENESRPGLGLKGLIQIYLKDGLPADWFTALRQEDKQQSQETFPDDFRIANDDPSRASGLEGIERVDPIPVITFEKRGEKGFHNQPVALPLDAADYYLSKFLTICDVSRSDSHIQFRVRLNFKTSFDGDFAIIDESGNSYSKPVESSPKFFRVPFKGPIRLRLLLKIKSQKRIDVATLRFTE